MLPLLSPVSSLPPPSAQILPLLEHPIQSNTLCEASLQFTNLMQSFPPLSPKSTMGNEMLETLTLPFIKEKCACVLNSVVEAFCSSLYNVPAVPSRVPCP